MRGRTGRRTDGRTDARTDARMHARTDARTHGYTHARTHARMHARTHARTHRCTHACTYARTHARRLSQVLCRHHCRRRHRRRHHHQPHHHMQRQRRRDGCRWRIFLFLAMMMMMPARTVKPATCHQVVGTIRALATAHATLISPCHEVTCGGFYDWGCGGGHRSCQHEAQQAASIVTLGCYYHAINSKIEPCESSIGCPSAPLLPLLPPPPPLPMRSSN